MPIELDVHNPAHVAGHSVLRADLGVGGRTLVVLSGTARPEFQVNDDGTVHRDTCRLQLRETTELLEQSTVCVGLASIGNDDSAWLFATDGATLETSGPELVLVVPLALLGDDTFLHRFAYQVVLSQRRVTTEITGTLTWPTGNFKPTSPEPSAVTPVFAIKANRIDETASPGGGVFGTGTVEHLVPIADGTILSVEIGTETCRATYRITDVPKGQRLRVTVDQQHLSSALQMAPEPPGVDLVELSAATPTKAGVDFKMIFAHPVA